MIFGHSWGLALGVLYAARFPQKVAAYVGSGQYGDAAAGETASYAYGLAEAERRGNRRALNKLREIGPPPHTAEQLMTERTWVTRLERGMGPRAWPNLARIALGVRESSIFDLRRIMRGFRFSLDAMWAEASRLNLLELAPALETPVFFFLGSKDHWVPPDASVAYFEALTAPSKNLVWFEQSGHEPFMDEPAKFNAAAYGCRSARGRNATGARSPGEHASAWDRSRRSPSSIASRREPAAWTGASAWPRGQEPRRRAHGGLRERARRPRVGGSHAAGREGRNRTGGEPTLALRVGAHAGEPLHEATTTSAPRSSSPSGCATAVSSSLWPPC